MSEDNLKLLNALIAVAALCLACFAIGLTIGSQLAAGSQVARGPCRSPEHAVNHPHTCARPSPPGAPTLSRRESTYDPERPDPPGLMCSDALSGSARYVAVLTSTASSLDTDRLPAMPIPSSTSPLKDALRVSAGSPSNASGFCIPLVSL